MEELVIASRERMRGYSLVGVLQIAGIGVFVLALIFFALTMRDVSGPNLPAVESSDESILPIVGVLTPAPTAKDVVVEATGTINVRNYIELVPEVSGRIVDLSRALRAGGSFAAGEVLIGIDDRDFRLALDQANAEVAGATSNLLLQQTEGEVASSNYALLHPSEPVPALVAKEPQIGQAQAQLLAAEARASAAQLDLSRTQMSLPFAGKVTSSTAEVGQMLSRGQSFGHVFALDSLEVTVPIGQEELQSLLPVEGRKALVYVGRGAMPDPISYEAKVERVAAELDERTRFSKLYLRLKGKPNVTPGTFIDVKVVGPTVANSLEIPESAEQGRGSVWIVRNNKLASVSPRVRSRSANGILVDAFDYGQGIVVGVVPSAYMGMRVRAVARKSTNE